MYVSLEIIVIISFELYTYMMDDDIVDLFSRAMWLVYKMMYT